MSQPDLPSKASSYSNAIVKGQHLLNMMFVSDPKAGAMLDPSQPSASSAFLSHSCLEEWSYIQALHPYDPSKTANLATSISLVLSHYFNTAVRIRHLHSESVSHEGTVYPSTSASFRSFINRANGLLVAQHNYSPAQIVAQSEMTIPVPKVQRWSDVAYLQ
jgi:hypothetical protein